MEKVASNWVIVAMVSLGCKQTFVEARTAGNCEIVAAMVASSSLPSLFRVSVAAKAVSNSAVSVASVTDASMLAAAAGTIGASNWSAIVATTASTSYSVVTVRRMVTFAFAAKHAEEKSVFVAADAMIASNFDRAAEESDTRSSMIAKVMVVSSWRSVFVAMTEARNSAVEGTAASKRWAVEAKVENSSRVAAAARDDHIRRVVEERIAGTESAAVAETVVSNSAVFEGRIASRVSAAAEKLADNWRPPEEKAENN